MKKQTLKLMSIACAAVTLVAVTGCKEKGPMEKAGEKMDDAGKKTMDAAKDAADKTKDAVDKATK